MKNKNKEPEKEPVELEGEIVDPGNDGTDDEASPAEAVFLEDVESMRQELNDLRTKADEYLDGWQRSRAEFANYKKRVERDQAQVYQNAAGSIIKRYLEVVDDLDRALKNRPAEGDGAAWSEGIELIYRKLMNLLDAEGVKVMGAEGEPFDPNRHEAISQEDSPNHGSGEIIEVVKKGYIQGDRVIRPALVRVAM